MQQKERNLTRRKLGFFIFLFFILKKIIIKDDKRNIFLFFLCFKNPIIEQNNVKNQTSI
jgi:hypothetical protein